MKKVILLSLITLFAGIAQAEKVAIVDTQYVFENANLTKQVKEEIIALTKESKDKIKAQEDELAKKQDDLLAKKSILSEDVYKEKENLLRQEIINFRKELKNIQKELNFKNKEKKQEIAAKISKAVETVANANGYDYVVAKTFVMFNKDSIEITDKVLEEVNK